MATKRAQLAHLVLCPAARYAEPDRAAPETQTAQSSPFPRLSHPRAGLSHAQWRALSPGEKLERLFGMSLDDIYEIMSWPIGELDPLRLSVRMQVLRVVFPIGAKALLDGTLGREATRERNRAAALARVDEALRARAPAASGRDD